MPAMSSDYDQLLAATIQHLESLQARGVRHVAVSPETLRAFSLPAPRPAPAAGAPSAIGQGPSAMPAAASSPAISSRPPAMTPPPAPVAPPPNPKPAQDFRPKTQASAPAAISVASAPPSAPSAAPPSALRPLTSAEKSAAFASLRERALACVKCPKLASSRQNVVFGVGSMDAALMFVGEAPGADEDAQGEPFVGAAGQLLTKIINTMGLQRSEVYIANILKCRPDMPAGSSGNRKPTPEEMQTCIPYLHEQIDLIRPRVLVALGGTAMEGLLNKTGITKLRGNWHTYRGIPLMPTYHPSYLLRNQSPTEKRRVWEDMLHVMEKLGMPISEKQQKFFLRG
jgi:DNA polymerase